ncbi:MAG: succinyl-diaminopimelate desuccinylase [Pseudomonadales bacterium]|nr:succinyl-diaminopimelate desuccinylase [Pseudomonadales bacterium]
MTSPTLALALELLRQPSITPDDAGCQTIMMQRLQALGFVCERLRYGEVDNFWARRGNLGPLLVFAGHTDVVPPGPAEQWLTPPFEPVLEDGYLRARGAADMKGSLAAMIIACESFIHQYPDHTGSLAFLITSDEEGVAADGTRRVVETLRARREIPDYCIVGEPSSHERLGDTIKVGRRGSLNAVLHVHGKQGHVAYPQRADNPLHRALPALTELTQEVWDQGNAFFPATSLQISNIHAGTGANNVIPGTLEVVFNFRFCTEVTEEQLRLRTVAILNRHGLAYDLQWQLSGLPFLTQQGALLEAAKTTIRERLGFDTDCSTTGGTSDGRFIAPLGTQVIELGPINATIHQINETVLVQDLDTLTSLYQGILERLML